MSIHIGDKGIKIVLDVGVDISSSTARKIRYKKPSEVRGEWNADLEGTTKISYVIKAGDVDSAGIWVLQAYVATAAWELSGTAVEMEVCDAV